MLGAVAGSSGMLAAALTVGPLRAFLNLTPPTPLGWALIGLATLAAVPLNRLLASAKVLGSDPLHAPRLAKDLERSAQGRAGLVSAT